METFRPKLRVNILGDTKYAFCLILNSISRKMPEHAFLTSKNKGIFAVYTIYIHHNNICTKSTTLFCLCPFFSFFHVLVLRFETVYRMQDHYGLLLAWCLIFFF